MSYSAIHIESEINGLLIFKKDHRCILRFSRLLIPNYLLYRSRREPGTLQCAISPQSRNRSYNSVSPYRYGMPIHSQTISKNTERNHPQLFHLKKDLHIQTNQPTYIHTYKQTNVMSNKQSSSKEPPAYDLLSLGSSLGTSLTGGKVVGTHSLRTRSQHNVYVSAVVLLSLLPLTSASTSLP